MEESTTREKILKKIRAALLNKSPDPYPRIDNGSHVFNLNDEDPVIVFSEHFLEAGGKFVLCENELEFVEELLNLAEQFKWTNIYCGEEGLSNLLTECEFPHDFEADPDKLDVVISSCECLVARSGSIVISSKSNGFVLPVYANVHVVCAKSSQIAMEMKDALHWLKHQYGKLPSGTTFITGPSGKSVDTGEIVSVSHGPSQLYVFLIDDKDRGFIESAPEEQSGSEE